VLIQPRNPAMQIVRFLQSIRSKLAATLAVGASIGKKHGVALPEKQLRIAAHPFAVVSEAMCQYNRVAVEISGTNIPAFEHGGICGGEAHLLQLRSKFLTNQRGRLLAMAQRPMLQPQARLCQANTGNR